MTYVIRSAILGPDLNYVQIAVSYVVETASRSSIEILYTSICSLLVRLLQLTLVPASEKV
jgi:hypothetical protein